VKRRIISKPNPGCQALVAEEAPQGPGTWPRLPEIAPTRRLARASIPA